MLNVAGSIIGGAFGMLTNKMNNDNAERREAKARWENYKYGEMQAQNADTRTRELYADLMSPAALRKQYQEAGLSPSLMFANGGGAGGSVPSGAQGASASVQPNVYGMNAMDAAQIGLALAQTENTRAQTEKTEAEKNKIEKQTEPEIIKMLSEAGAANAAKAASEAQTEGLKLDNYLKEHTNDANIFMVCELADKTAYEATKMYHAMRSAKVLADLDENLYETNIEKGKKELEQLLTSIKLNNQQREYLRNEVLWSFEKNMQAWKELDIQERNTKSYEDWINAQIPNIEKQLEIRLKELGIEKTRLVVNAITDVIKGVGTTAVALSMFKGGKGSNQTPDIKNFQSGGNALDPKRGLKHAHNKSIWEY